MGYVLTNKLEARLRPRLCAARRHNQTGGRGDVAPQQVKSCGLPNVANEFRLKSIAESTPRQIRRRRSGPINTLSWGR
jgi:hypothetical protein